MTFREWCLLNWGLTYFTEGKVQHGVLIPALTAASISLSSEMAQHGGYLIQNPYIQAVVLSTDNFSKLKMRLKHDYSTSTGFVEDNSANNFIANHFRQYGLDISDEREHNEPSYIHFYFEDVEKKEVFLTRFSYLNPLLPLNPQASSRAVQFPPHAIQCLLDLYYNGCQLINNPQSLEHMQTQLGKLNQLLTNIDQHHFRPRLDYASLLSRDYTNGLKNGFALHSLHATSAYSISLKVYAEINRDNLSLDDYLKLNYAATLLAAYDEEGHLKQSLKTDAKFIRDMKTLFDHSQTSGNIIPLRGLPPLASAKLITLIEQDIHDSLQGNPYVSLGKNAYFRKARFLPDAKMQSDTDELILNGGGRLQHFAIYRIIKVGFLANGLKAGMNTPAHFYKYYKVENNLGSGAHGISIEDNTCYGTYITELSPFALINGQFTPIVVSPYTHPNHYQTAMAFTLFELIKTERELLLYNDTHEASKSFESNEEVNEWQRLHSIAVTLSGTPVDGILEYLSADPFESGLYYECDVFNLREHIQEGGSCPIFSLKSLVASIIGKRLTALHINFMQLNSSSMCINAVESKIKQLELWHSSISSVLEQDALSTDSAMRVDEPIPSAINQFSFFADSCRQKEESIKHILLSEDKSICLITQIHDAATEDISFELVCPSSARANQLLLSIINALPEDLFISKANNVIELPLHCMQLLCNVCSISYEHLTNIATIKTINVDASSSSNMEP